MWISSLILHNIRCFQETNINFSENINVIIGANNSGKSTILKAILNLQQESTISKKDSRHGSSKSRIEVRFGGTRENLWKYFGEENPPLNAYQEVFAPIVERYLTNNMGKKYTFVTFPSQEPNNLIYPYLSQRKVAAFQEQINLDRANAVTGDLSNLFAKVDRISNPEFQPAYDEYIEACDRILGFRISTSPSNDGKKAVYIINNLENIPIDMMGEGTANLLGLIVDLCISEEKVYLLEEPENDIHPKALRELLRFICRKAQNNQFMITTHSNIVMKYLGAQPNSKIFSVSMNLINKLPTSIVTEVEKSPEAKRKTLEDLGYELFDFDLWDGWLILEESSAEKIIREYLIPWFVPKLKSRLRTFSARTIDEVETKFADFNNLFVFLHLQPQYTNRAWVIVDAGEREKDVIEKLKSKYTSSGWNEDQFRQFSQHDFEKFYPLDFQKEVNQILVIANKKQKRSKKIELLKKVENWILEDQAQAKVAFKESAQEVISTLRTINKVLNSS